MEAKLIVVDWGTTSFRAWLVDGQGEVMDEIPSGTGMRDMPRDAFPAYCGEQLARWRADANPIPVYMAGMVGAAQGWQTAPQPILPVSLADLASQVVAAEGLHNAWIIPGTRVQRSNTEIDVMRGEEVQIFGALDLLGKTDALLCLPGTHSKWATVTDGALTHFTTSMTGEVYEALLGHTILAKTAERAAPFSEKAFRLGLEQSHGEGGLLHLLFSARCRNLYGDLTPELTPSYLSGLLIGREVRAMRAHYPQESDLVVVASDALRGPYGIALTEAGFKTTIVATKAASLAGIGAVARNHKPLEARVVENLSQL